MYGGSGKSITRAFSHFPQFIQSVVFVVGLARAYQFFHAAHYRFDFFFLFA
jgi:hypothetical protein